MRRQLSLHSKREFQWSGRIFYTVRDGVAGFDIGRVAITVLPVNDAPYTEPDTYRTREDEVLVAPEPQGMLRNDREVDGERLVHTELVGPAQHGEVVVIADGSFTYTAVVNFNGRDAFRYRVYDESGLWSEEDVEILVTPVTTRLWRQRQLSDRRMRCSMSHSAGRARQ